MNTLDVISDLQLRAKALAYDQPAHAAAIAEDAAVLLRELPGCPVPQVAHQFGVSRDTVYQWVKNDILRRTLPQRRILVDPASVTALIPVLNAWREAGKVGRPTTAFQQWLKDEAVLQSRASTVELPNRNVLGDWLQSHEELERTR